MTTGKRKNNYFKDVSDSFAAIGFEIANERLTSVCSVGIMKEGIVVDRFYHLIVSIR
ncbi:MAG: hypothetical protein LBU37_02545 [Tannerellaceae bacterium]|jgi:hypothetical protein|nr:hypothetical protein [Tannerellaceae bacterium]